MHIPTELKRSKCWLGNIVLKCILELPWNRPVVRPGHFCCRDVWVRSLVRKLRSPVPHGKPPKNAPSGYLFTCSWIPSLFIWNYHSTVNGLWKCKVKVVSDPVRLHECAVQWNSPGQSTGMDSCSLLQGIFPTQESNPGLPHCRRILHQLSHKGRPRILEWVAYLFSSRSSRPRSQNKKCKKHIYILEKMHSCSCNSIKAWVS